MANDKRNNKQEVENAINNEKIAQKNKQINNQEEFGAEENLNEFKRNKNIVSERTAWH